MSLRPISNKALYALYLDHILSDCTSVCAGWGWCWRVWLLVVTELYLLLSGSDTEDGGGSLAPPRPSSPGIMQPHRPGHRTVRSRALQPSLGPCTPTTRTVRSRALHPPPGPCCTLTRALHPSPGACTHHQGPAPITRALHPPPGPCTPHQGPAAPSPRPCCTLTKALHP